eukprot:12491246-Alexandrium_andersonii.AAC.1
MFCEVTCLRALLVRGAGLPEYFTRSACCVSSGLASSQSMSSAAPHQRPSCALALCCCRLRPGPPH